MPEAGWLLLLLFLGVCSLIVVGILYPKYHRSQKRRYPATGETEPLEPASDAQRAETVEEPSLPLSVPALPLEDWLGKVNDHPDDAPHTLVIGTSGTGKTTVAQAIAATRAGYLAILDPKWKPGKWGGLPAVPIDDDGKYTQIENAIGQLLSELNGRLVSLKSGTINFPELTIIAEELPTLISECPSAATLFKQVGRLGRELRIRVVGLSQSDRVKSLGVSGEGDAIDNYTLIRLGKAAVAVLSESQALARPAVILWMGTPSCINLSGVVRLASQPIPLTRSWPFQTPKTDKPEQGQQPPPQPEPEPPADLTLSVPEIAQVVMSITSGMDRLKAIRAMPRYQRRYHRQYAAFYDQLRTALLTPSMGEGMGIGCGENGENVPVS